MDKLRQELRDLDQQIIDLINQRYDAAQEATNKGLPVPDLTVADLEKQALEELSALNQGPMQAQTLQAVYREILSGQFDLVRPGKVAFFGTAGSFTHQATMQKSGESVDVVARPTIPDVFDDVAKGVVDFGVVPVENSTEGAVTVTFDYFQEANVRIYSEVYLRIHHYLMAKCSLENLKVVYSHPQVFGQTRRWTQQNLPNVDLVEVSNTTAAAKRAASEPNSGALGSILAAEKFDLPILASNIEDFSENITRFLVLSKHESQPTDEDKTSMMLAINDRVGALYDSLLPFKNHGVTLSMIQSRPSKKSAWDYVFFVDCLGNAQEAPLKDAIAELSDHCNFVKILGSYPKAPDPR